MTAEIKPAMLGCSGDPKSYYVSDIPEHLHFLNMNWSALSSFSAMNFCRCEKPLHVQRVFLSSLHFP